MTFVVTSSEAPVTEVLYFGLVLRDLGISFPWTWTARRQVLISEISVVVVVVIGMRFDHVVFVVHVCRSAHDNM